MERYKVIKEMVYRIYDNEKNEVMEEVPSTYLFTCSEEAKRECNRINNLYSSALDMVKNNYSWCGRTKKIK